MKQKERNSEIVSRSQFEFECKVLQYLALTSSRHKGMFEYLFSKVKKVAKESSFFQELLK